MNRNSYNKNQIISMGKLTKYTLFFFLGLSLLAGISILTSCNDEKTESIAENFEKYRFGDWQISKFILENHPFRNVNSVNIFFANEVIGYAIQDENIFKSTDSGKTWTELDSVINFLASDVQFLDENTGFLAGDEVTGSFPIWPVVGGILLKTKDGGENWSHIAYPPRQQYGQTNSRFLEDIHFFDELNGLGFIFDWQLDTDNNLSIGWSLARTRDGGNSWINLNINVKSIRKKIYVAQNFVYVIAEENKVYRSTNGGNVWETLYLPLNEVQQLYFYNELTGFAVGDDSILFKTEDGGINWSLVNLEFSSISLINFYNENEGIVVDFYSEANIYSRNRGCKMHQTMDGGETWISSEFIENFNFTKSSSRSLGYSIFHDEFYKLERI